MLPLGSLLGVVAPQGASAPDSGRKPEEGDFVATLVAALGRVDEVAAKALPTQLEGGAASEGTMTERASAVRDVTSKAEPATDTTATTEAAAPPKGAAPTSDIAVDFVGSAVPLDEALVPGPTAPGRTDTVTPVDAPTPLAPKPTAADRDPDRIAPELQSRIDRIVERMQREFGHRVELVEGYRAPERQAQLFAQGRTAPGPVVTWTKQSAHTDGRAADLMVDGGFDDPVAYARLQQIAREEGLRTLGMQDRGHVELASGTPPDRDDASPDSSAPAPKPRRVAPGVARVARVAQVAQVARPGAPVFVAPANGGGIDFSLPGGSGLPATPMPIQAPRLELDPRFGFDLPIDRLADAEKPGAPSVVPESSLDGPRVGSASSASAATAPLVTPRSAIDAEILRAAPPSGTTVPLVAPSGAIDAEISRAAPQIDRGAQSGPSGSEGLAAIGDGASRTRSETDAESRDGDPRRERETASLTSSQRSGPSSMTAAEARAAALEILARGTGGSFGAVRPVGEMGNAGTLQSLERVLQAQELARSAPTNRVTVRLDGTAGAIDTVRVGLSGQDVTANFDVSDVGTSRLLRSRVNELYDALGRRGMDLGPLGIRTAGGSEGVLESLLGSRTDSNSELLRTLLGGTTAENGRDREGTPRERSNYRMNDDRSGSDRSGRDARKEGRQ